MPPTIKEKTRSTPVNARQFVADAAGSAEESSALFHLTGNEFVSLSHLKADDGSLYAANLLSKAHKGLLEFACDCEKAKPFLKPVLFYRKKRIELTGLNWTTEHSWIPVAETSSGKLSVRLRWIAPPNEKACMLGLEVRSESGDIAPGDVLVGLAGAWGPLCQYLYICRPLQGQRRIYNTMRNSGLLCEFSQGRTGVAFCVSCANKDFSVLYAGKDPLPSSYSELLKLPALGTDEAATQDDSVLNFCIAAPAHVDHGVAHAAFFVGFGQDETSATAAAGHLDRMGAQAVGRATAGRLTQLTLDSADPVVKDAINRNAMFCHFYSTGRTFDTEELCCFTSRHTDYYVNGAYWDRDALLWTFPCILQQDQALARELLEYAFTTQLRNAGVHSRFLDGTVLEPGMELDQLCLPVTELVHYIRFTNDYEFPRSRFIQEGIATLRSKIMELKFKKAFLFKTFLNSTDNVPPYSCLTYMNVVAWRFFFDLAFLEEKLDPEGKRSVENRNNALRLRREIYTHCVRQVNGKDVFAYAVSMDDEALRVDPLHPDGETQQKMANGIYDDPMGSLLTLPYWGFCKPYDPVYANTVDLLLSRENEHSHSGKKFDFSGSHYDGQTHGPSVASLANQLLVRINQQKIRDLLPELAMDNGLACESIHCDSGRVASGRGMASMAGFWAYAMYRGLAKVAAFGWPEPKPEEVAKTEGAIRRAALDAGVGYPRPIKVGPDEAQKTRAIEPRVIPASGISKKDRSFKSANLERGSRALTREQIDKLASVSGRELPDDIGNRYEIRAKEM